MTTRDANAIWAQGASRREWGNRLTFWGLLIAILVGSVLAAVYGKAAQAQDMVVQLNKPFAARVFLCDTVDEAMSIHEAAKESWQAGFDRYVSLTEQSNADGERRCGRFKGVMRLTDVHASAMVPMENGAEVSMTVATVEVLLRSGVKTYVAFMFGVTVEDKPVSRSDQPA